VDVEKLFAAGIAENADKSKVFAADGERTAVASLLNYRTPFLGPTTVLLVAALSLPPRDFSVNMRDRES
jgi:hypothetical protein